MSITLGYKIPGSRRGAVFTVPDAYHGYVSFEDADRIANELRTQGKRITWQKVRGMVMSLGSGRAAIAIHGVKP